MNVILSAFVVAFAISTVSAAPQKYTDKYDKVDIDAILKNDRILTSYIKCILDKGPCTQEGRDFKAYIPEAIETNCGKCTDAQKKIVKKASKHIMERRKNEWEQIRKKYDPNGEYQERFFKFLAEA